MATATTSWSRLTSAPAVMVAALGSTIAFALGHHFFYRHLHDTNVPPKKLDQMVNTAIGTAFAFVVNATIAAAITTAYSQMLWHGLLRQRLSVATIDSLSTLPASPAKILDARLLFSHPFLVTLAILSWAMTLPTAFTPGTLAVQLATTYSFNTTDVVVPDWTAPWALSGPRTGLMGDCGDPPGVYVSDTSIGASHIALSVQFFHGLPQLPLLGVNTSYEIDFYGPALQCGNIAPPVRDDWCPYCVDDESDRIGYAAWVHALNASMLEQTFFPTMANDSNAMNSTLLSTLQAHQPEAMLT